MKIDWFGCTVPKSVGAAATLKYPALNVCVELLNCHRLVTVKFTAIAAACAVVVFAAIDAGVITSLHPVVNGAVSAPGAMFTEVALCAVTPV